MKLKLKFTDIEKEIIAKKVPFGKLNALKRKLYSERGRINYEKHIKGNTSLENPRRSVKKEAIYGAIKGLQYAVMQMLEIKESNTYYYLDEVDNNIEKIAFDKLELISNKPIRNILQEVR